MSISREKLSQFLNNSCTEDGSFVMHKDGEVDIRYSMLFSIYEITLEILVIVFVCSDALLTLEFCLFKGIQFLVVFIDVHLLIPTYFYTTVDSR